MRSVDNFLIALIHLYQLGRANDVMTANGNCWQIFLFSTNLVFLTRNDRYNLQPTNLQPTTYNLQPTTYNLQPTTDFVVIRLLLVVKGHFL